MSEADLLDILVCPACRGELGTSSDSAHLVCGRCGIEYPWDSGVPVLISPDLRRHQPHDVRTLTHKTGQIAYFDGDPRDDFGVTRPRGAPRLYEALLRDKFRRSVLGLEHLLPGWTVLVVCGGSGLDAEFLVERGARVIVSDISLGVLRQAEERSRRYGLGFDLVVADVEALPFADRSVDLVYVHDGLHHLERPLAGLSEMARVARHAVSVSEPARSVASMLAVRVSLAEACEEAGNPVARLTLDDVVGEARRHGFRPLRPHRYAMFYRHWPGRSMRVLSRPGLLSLTVAMLGIANRLLGRFGNKLTVQALRTDT